MPELPEVEAARVLVHEYCKGKRIGQAIAADDTKVIEGVTPEEMQNALQGRTIVDAHRKGKHLWLELDGDSPAVLFHLGMTGYMVVEGVPIVQYVNAKKRGEEWPPKYWKVVIETDCGVKLAFCDPRRFGKIRLQADPENNEPISKLGFDPILSMPDLETFSAMLRNRRRAVKAMLLDQSFSAGVGNWVADEILYQARIHPEQEAASLDEAQCSALHHQMQAVPQTAVEAGADSEKFPKTWLFHQKWGNGKKGPAPRLEGNKIEYKQVGGRTTAFVPALQKLTAQAAEKPKLAKKAADSKDTAGAAAAPKKARKRAAPKAPKAQAAAEEEEEDEEEPEEEVMPKKKDRKSKVADGKDEGKKAAPAKTRRKKT